MFSKLLQLPFHVADVHLITNISRMSLDSKHASCVNATPFYYYFEEYIYQFLFYVE